MEVHYDPALHHRRSVRLKGYDYSSPGLYFVTLCVEHRECLLGHIVDDLTCCGDLPGSASSATCDHRVELTPLGCLVEEEWKALPVKYPGLRLREFVIMPNHLHGILELLPLEEQVPIAKERLPQASEEARSPSLGNILAYFKYQTTKRASLASRLWQRSFYDVIIRDLVGYRAIVSYIIENPRNWREDELYP